MKAITLRNLPQDLAKRIEEESAERGTSLNKTVIHLLEVALAHAKGEQKPSLNHDLDALAGSWTADEANEFDQSLAEHRTIDKELWA